MSSKKTSSKVKKRNAQLPASKELFAATRMRDVQKVKDLIKKEANVNARDMDDALQPTPLLIASENQYHDIVQLLIKAKPKPANVNLENMAGKRPIWWAARYGDEQLARLLIKDSGQTCQVNFIDKATGCSPLYRAVTSNSAVVCRLLIKAGADVNMRRLELGVKQGASAETPLIKAVQLDNKGICDVLINSLVDIQAKTSEGLTALHYAVAYRRYEIADLLMHNRIKLHAKTKGGVTAMAVAIEQYNPAMCKKLIEHGYDINRAFDWGETPLEMSIRLHNEDCALTLVHWGASLHPPEGRISYFFMAASEGLINLMKFIMHIRPTILNEAWVRQQKFPIGLNKYPEFSEHIYNLSQTVFPLTHLCKAKIFLYLKKYAPLKVKKLPLPTELCRQVVFESQIDQNIYKLKTLYDEECPYVCPSNCPRHQCPELDFTDSESD